MASRRQGASGEIEPKGPQADSNGLGREQVSDIQRVRMLAAMAEAAAELGGGSVTVTDVVGRSGVSRRTFYELFESCEDCFLAAFEEAVQRLAAVVVPAYRSGARWREQTREGLTALLELLESEQAVGRLVIVESFGAGIKGLARRQRVLAQIIAVVDEGGRTEAKRGEDLPSLTAEGVVGSVLSIVHARMVDDRSHPLVELVNPLMSMIVLPYLGPAAARKELRRPTPKRAQKAERTGNPLKGLEMRLTYRTVRVLMAIGDQPGVSNRRIADAAGVSDQGQISKLLARLGQIGLIENSGFGQSKGESNSWYLTERGREIERAIASRSRR